MLNLILNKIDKNGNDIFINKYKGRNSITWNMLIQAYIDHGMYAYKYLGFNTSDNIFNKPKKCTIIKNKTDFAKNNHGVCYICEKEYRYFSINIKKEYDIQYRLNNKENIKENKAKRRAAKIQSIPSWYEKELITKLYKYSCKEIHIDHIILLINDKICGLHCFDNLQILSAKENLSKGNKFDSNFVEDLIMYNLALDGLGYYEFIDNYL